MPITAKSKNYLKSRKFIPTKTTQPCPTPQRTTDGDRAAVISVRQKILDLVEKHPDKAAIILTEWLKAPTKSATPENKLKKAA
jgi:hypothetical protein